MWRNKNRPTKPRAIKKKMCGFCRWLKILEYKREKLKIRPRRAMCEFCRKEALRQYRIKYSNRQKNKLQNERRLFFYRYRNVLIAIFARLEECRKRHNREKVKTAIRRNHEIADKKNKAARKKRAEARMIKLAIATDMLKGNL